MDIPVRMYVCQVNWWLTCVCFSLLAPQLLPPNTRLSLQLMLYNIYCFLKNNKCWNEIISAELSYSTVHSLESSTIASVKKTFKFEMFSRKSPERKKAPLHDSVFKQLLVLILVILVILLTLHRCFIRNSEWLYIIFY